MIALLDLIALSSTIIALGLFLVKPESISKLSYSLLILILLISILVYGFSAFEWLRTYVADWPFARFDGTATLHNLLQDAQAISWLLLILSFTLRKPSKGAK